MDTPEPPPYPYDPSLMPTFLLVGVALIFFYFVLWRPEKRQREAMEKKREELQKGDKVIAVGMIGTVSRIEKDTVILKMHDGAKIEVLKMAISDVFPREGEVEKQ